MTPDNRIAPDPEPRTMNLYDDYVPGIDDGAYRLVVQQTVTYADPETQAPKSYHYYQDRRFVVQGPRYSIPPDDIHAVFPPRGGIGDYQRILPHVVLRKRALPWERLLLSAPAPNPVGKDDEPVLNPVEKCDAPAPNPVDKEDEPAPWLALLVLSQAELTRIESMFDQEDGPPAPPNKASDPADQGGRQLLLSITTPAELLASDQIERPGSKITLLPQLDPEDDEGDHDTKVQVLELPLDDFRKLCPPNRKELTCLAHLRSVDTSNKVPMQMHADGEFAVLIANRFPQPGINYVYLVSLEGWSSLIEGKRDTSEADRVRLVTLGVWAFSNDEGIYTFGELMKNLDVGVFGIKPPGTQGDRGEVPPGATLSEDIRTATIQQPIIGSGDPRVDAYLQHGYAPLEYQPADGSTPTFAWYRGPLAPMPVDSFDRDGQLFHRADAALMFDAESGMMDVSYAAAWQLGQLLALADGMVSRDLRAFSDATYDVFAAPGLIEDLLENDRPMIQILWAQELAALAGKLQGAGYDDNQAAELLDAFRSQPMSEGQAEAALARLEATVLSEADLARIKALSGAPAEAKPQAAAKLLDWLARLVLLYPVPFEYLVAHARLLPPESLRLFYIDTNWLEALVDGALSLAYDCTHDRKATQTRRNDLHTALSKLVYQYRQRLLYLADMPEPQSLADLPEPQAGVSDANAHYMDEVKCGLLLRSAVVSGWPGLEVEFYAPGGAPARVLRMDHLAPDLLFCVVEGEIGHIILKEPAEGIRFGVDDDCAVLLRHWQGGSPGKPLGGDEPALKLNDAEPGDCTATPTAIFPFSYSRAGALPGVLDVGKLFDDLKTRIGSATADSPAPAEGVPVPVFGPAAFALQMLLSPEYQEIRWKDNP